MHRFFTFIFLISFLPFAQAQKPDLKFKHLTGANGLSQTHAICMKEDYQGFVWIGTQNGLNKFDGYDVTVYKTDPDDSTSITTNQIISIFEDSEKNLWIGTSDGLDMYDRRYDHFQRIEMPESEIPTYINAIYEDRKGNLWLATGTGLYVFDKKDRKFTHYTHNTNDGNSLSSDQVLSVCEDNQGNMWIATSDKLNVFDTESESFRYFEKKADNTGLSINNTSSVLLRKNGDMWIGTFGGGINVYHFQTKTFTHYQHDPKNDASLSNNQIFCLFEDNQENVWIGTENGGLDFFDNKTEKFYHYVHDVYDPQSIINNSVAVVFKDKSGILWIGTHNGGVSYGQPYQSNFRQYRQDLNEDKLSHNNIKALLEDYKGDIWIGTDGGGLNQWVRKEDKFIYYRYQAEKNSVSSDVIVSLLEDDKNLWIGTYGGGLSFYDRNTDTFTHYKFDPTDSESISSNVVWDIVSDEDSNLWLATREGGMCKLDKKTKKFTRYLSDLDDPNSLSNNWTTCVYIDSQSNLWVGTYGGLNLFDRKRHIFTRYRHNQADPKSISSDQVNNIHEDKNGNLWIATPDGLNLFDRSTKSFSVFTQKDGLPIDLIQSIEEDDHGNLWFTTLNHIVKFDIGKKIFKTYLGKNGIYGNEFLQNVSLKTKQGELIFGGLNGFDMFFPDSIKSNNYIPPVYLTDFQIFNKSVPVDGNSPLQCSITEAQQVTLSYHESVFSFKFAALNYVATEKNQYAYKMEGFDNEWNYVGTQRTATYTNLDAGEYVFRVKASNNDGLWNERGTSVKIIITPPYWKTWWFRSLAAAFFISSISLFYLFKIKAIKKQKEQVEKQVKERTAEVIAQKEELAAQAENLQVAHKELELVHKEVKDSIRSAQLIQKSILPSQKVIGNYLPEHFIFYRPKDVVSGDFYWFDVIDDQIVIAAVDCTGHGVSGAFMAINGHYLLNNAIYPYPTLVASEVLERLNQSLIKELHQRQFEYEVNGGMDVALCILNIKEKKLQYAGANNPLYILRDGNIIQMEPTRKAIGISISKRANLRYENKVVDLQKNDVIYLFSDGYPDQIGGRQTMKFMYPRFRDLLIEIGNRKMNDQLAILQETLEQWKGSEEQLDDILVMGFKI